MMGAVAILSTLLACLLTAQDAPDLILHNGRIVTVDTTFSVHAAMAVKDGKILRLGGNEEILKTRGAGTKVLDLEGRMVIPGLIDSHVHATGAAMHEFDHPIPDMQSVGDVLKYVRARAKVLKPSTWIFISQVFITRLAERRYPTRAELDRAAPKHPVIFRTGPDCSLNSLALEVNGIDKNFKARKGSTARVERDQKTGEPTGIIRRYSSLPVKYTNPARSPEPGDRIRRVRELFADYNSVGITAVVDRNASGSALDLYKKLRKDGHLTVRIRASHSLGTGGDAKSIAGKIRKIARHPLRAEDPMLRIIGVKVFLDGGMLTGSAYMRKPWGVSKIYSITDPEYRGIRFVSGEKLVPIVRATVESGMQFTAHSVGDGAVHALLDAYEKVNASTPVRPTRPSITHSNFMSREAVEQAARLGVVLDIQPAWLYLDTRTLSKQFSYERLRYFQPLRSIFEAGGIAGGGSDHMQKIGSLRSVNPYNPFLGMWITLTRRARDYEGQLHPEEALTRRQALRFYTANNAYLMFMDSEIGTLEPGKRADFVILDRDLLACPVDAVRDTKVIATYLDGKKVFGK